METKKDGRVNNGGHHNGGRKKKATNEVTRNFNFPEELWESIDKKNTGKSRTKYIVEAVMEKIERESTPPSEFQERINELRERQMAVSQGIDDLLHCQEIFRDNIFVDSQKDLSAGHTVPLTNKNQ